jgi:hypothetical protein
MGRYDTHGWDAVVQLGEPALDDALACRFATGDLQLPAGGEFRFGDASFSVHMLYETPRARLVTDAGDGGEPGVRLVVPFDESYVRYAVPLGGRDEPFEGDERDVEGEIHYTVPLRLRTDGDRHRLVLATEAATASVEFEPETRRMIDADGDLFANVYEATVEEPNQTVLDRLRDLPATISDRLDEETVATHGGGLPEVDLDVSFRAVDATVTVVDGPTSAARCLIVAADLADDGGGHDPFRDCARPGVTTASVELSTEFVLSELVCPRLADRLNLSEDDFEAPCRLASPTQTSLSVGGGRESFVVESLSASVEDGAIVVDGDVRATRPVKLGGTAVIDGSLDARIDVDYASGDLSLTVAHTDVDLSVDVPWYVDVAAVFNSHLRFAIRDLPDMLARAAEDVLTGKGVTVDAAERARDLLGEQVDQLSVGAFEFDRDALVFGGSLLPDRHCPPESTGTLVVPTDEAVDLDDGDGTWDDVVLDAEVDLRWATTDEDAELRPRNGAAVTLRGVDGPFARWRGADYETLSVLDLEAAVETDWTDDPVPGWRFDTPEYPFVGHYPRVFGVLTSDGRYAKCAAYRQDDGRLHLRYATFQRPEPDARLRTMQFVTAEEAVGSGVAHWTEVECTPGAEGQRMHSTHRSAAYTDYERALRIEAAASATRLAWPLSYDWSLGGESLRGDGTVTVDGHEVRHETSEGTCTIWTEQGESLDADLAVTVTDSRDLRERAVVSFDFPERFREGGKPDGVDAETRREIDECARMPGDPGEWRPTGLTTVGGGPTADPPPEAVGGRGPVPGTGRLSPGESADDPLREALSEGLSLSDGALSDLG